MRILTPMQMKSKVGPALVGILCAYALSLSNASAYCVPSPLGPACVDDLKPIPSPNNTWRGPRDNRDPPDWDPRMCSYFSFKWCATGEKCMSDDTCIPKDDTYYGNGYHCPATQYFNRDDKTCIPPQDERVCPDGKSFCGAGEACVDNGTACITKDSPRYCGYGSY